MNDMRPAVFHASIFSATLIAYFPALRGGFAWNDADYVTQSGFRSLAGLARIWFKVGATEQYYPVLHSAFWIEHRLWGDAPLGYHLLNVLLHAAAACLFGVILRRLAVPGAWLGALLFALHPVCVESVAWISEEKNTLSAVFYLLAALVYLRFDERDNRSVGGGWRDYLLATGLFVGALLSKSVTATLPAALLVVSWWRHGRISWRRDVAPLLPWFALGAGVGLFTGWVERTFVIGGLRSEFALSFFMRWVVAGRAVWFYLGKLLWPHPLTFFYPRWEIESAGLEQALYPLSVLAALLVLWSIRRRSRGPVAVGMLFVGSLFPTLGFFDVFAFRFSFVADHFQYLACMGVLAGLAAALSAALAGVHRIAAGCLVLCLFGILVWRQCGVYHDPETFYRAILADNPSSWIAHNNLGNALLDQKRGDEAIAEYRAALGIRPGYPEAENDLGTALAAKGLMDGAIGEYRRAVRLEPDFVQAHLNLALALWAVGRRDEAIAEHDTAVRLESSRR